FRMGLGALSLVAGTLYAQEAAPSPVDSSDEVRRVQELMPVEIRAVRVNDESPFATSNLEEAAIQVRNLGQDIPYVLNHTPSVVVTSDGGAGVGYTGLRIRGTDASRINFTINGIPIN